MIWKPELDDLARREAFAREMGGVDKVKRQRDQGRLTVRERIDKLRRSKITFHEIGAISGIAEYDENNELKHLTPANCVFGRARVDGRTVVVVGDDFTVRGGSADASISAKPLMAEEMAHDFRLPIIRDDRRLGRRRLGEDHRDARRGQSARRRRRHALRTGTRRLTWRACRWSDWGSAPSPVSARRGSRPRHYSIMTKNSAMFVAGPPVVKRLGQDLTKQELGGAEIQTRAGASSIMPSTPRKRRSNAPGASCPTCRRRSTNCRRPLPATDDPERAEESLMKAVPRNRRQVYKMRPIIDAVVDKGSFFRDERQFRPSDHHWDWRGWKAARCSLLASDPFHYGGSWTAEACQKVVRWVDFAETFHLPVVYLMDCPGFMIGLEAEKSATIRHGVRAMAARQPDHRALVHHHRAQRLSALPASCISRPIAFRCAMPGRRPVGIAAAGRRHRGGLPRRHRRSARSRGEVEGDRGSPQQAALAVPFGRKILG